MKKTKNNSKKRKSTLNRGLKRAKRLKKTQAEKSYRNEILNKERKKKEEKFQEGLNKLMETRRV